MKVFVVSDTHFNHENIKVFENRPDNYHDLITKHWNSRVTMSDLVIHLGDVIFSRPAELASLMAGLNGRKVLALGNHDHKSLSWYMENGFDFASDYFIFKGIAFSHCPLTPLPKQGNFHWSEEVKLNIHGHFHRNIPNGEDFTLPNGDLRTFNNELYDWSYYKEHKDKYRLVQIEDELRPFNLDELVSQNGGKANPDTE